MKIACRDLSMRTVNTQVRLALLNKKTQR